MLKRKSKRVLSIVLAVAMIVGLFPIAAFAEEGVSTTKTIYVDANATESDGTNNTYKTLTAAITAASAGYTIELKTDVKLDGKDKGNNEGLATISKNLTINGGNHIISAENVSVTDGKGPSMINIESGANVTVNDLVINGAINNEAKTKHGLNIYQAGMVTLNNVTVQNNRWYAVVNNGSALVVNGLTTTGNQWGINVDSKVASASVVVNDANISESSSLVLEKSSSSEGVESPKATVNGGSMQYIIKKAEMTGEDLTINGGHFATAGEGAPESAVTDYSDFVAPGNMINADGDFVIDNMEAVAKINNFGYATLQAAIDAAKDGDTVTVIGDATEEHIAIRDKALTINGAGAAKVSDITVVNIADKKNVTINNLTFVGASTENNSDTNPAALYLQNVGTATVKGCTFDLADSATGTTIAITSVTTDDVIVEDCTIDGYTIAGYHNPGCVNVTYTDNTIKNAPSGIAFVATDNVVVKNNTFENSNGIRLEPDWATPADTCDKATFTGNKIISLSSDASSQYAIRATNSNGENGFSGENLIIDHNYWGSANPDFDSIIKVADGATFTVDPEPYYTAPTMGAEDLNTYEPPYNGKYSYEIFTKVGENGTIAVDRYATEGDDVTITVSPDEAYLLDELTVTANGKEIEVKDNGDGTYTFKMPSADAKIVVTFAEDPDWKPEPEEPAMPFTDVNEGDWFYDVVLYAYDNGLMTGVSATEFAPNQTTTRGMIVSMLARLEGVTSAEDAGFADVAANDWYATAVNWAASVGVVNGYEDNTFRPNAPITREQMAAILYNYADYKGYDVSARADLSDYADAADVSSWAEDVLSWANAEGLINGMTTTTIDPQGATTRAQTAAMFERFLTAHEA